MNWTTALVGAGALLAGIGTFLSGWAAYRALKRKVNGS